MSMSQQQFVQYVRRLSTDDWLELLITRQHSSSLVADHVPELPSDEVQIATAGKSGRSTMQEASDFYHKVKEIYRTTGDRVEDAFAVDFGCGWGRITRFFLKDLESSNILGVDVRASIVELARKLAPSLMFEKIEPYPPLPVEIAQADIVVAYSVFSHLSEQADNRWVEEFARVVKPNGLVCITTRARKHLVNCERMAGRTDLSGTQRAYANMLQDYRAAIEAYDQGEFVYAPTGGGQELTSDFYGEAVIPRAYVERNWNDAFELVDFVEDYSALALQPIIAMRRR